MKVKFFDNSGITELGKGTLITFYYCSRVWFIKSSDGMFLGCTSSITGKDYYIPVKDVVTVESEV